MVDAALMTNKFAVRDRISGVTYPILQADESAKWPAPSEGWNGDIAAIYIRNSRHVQRGNNRSKWQLDLASYLMGSGYAVKIYDEQGVSGARLSERDVATQMVVDLRAGIVTCIAVAELSRLTRDDRAFDAEYLADVLIEYGQGKLITYAKVFDLSKAEARREYGR